MQFTSPINTILLLTVLAARGASAHLCTPIFQGSSKTTSWSVCARATGANADPAPVTAYFRDKLGCARIVNGDANPLVGAVQANGCTSAAFVKSDDVPGFAINAVLYQPACPPGSKGCARKMRRRWARGPGRRQNDEVDVAGADLTDK
ncbi:hypothetical protein PG993_010915 [Apiospora rasikravindrae]|uniref:Uncharacterized protein n=1 Tax=Apiospora rasikravindrae TaxID=990691 RepID=A0ABR1SEG5_9PEZI